MQKFIIFYLFFIIECEGGELEVQMFNLAQMFIRIPMLKFSTKAPLLQNPCYALVPFSSSRSYFNFISTEFGGILNLSITLLILVIQLDAEMLICINRISSSSTFTFSQTLPSNVL